MSDTVGSLTRHALLAACLLIVLAVPVAAQPPPGPAPSGPQFMSRYDFHLEGTKLLTSDDDQFVWDTHFGGNFDFVDYVVGRMFFLADYQAVLGREFQPFDPNQGNYTLEAAGSVRVGKTEIVGVLHHVSRHFGDRPKIVATAWNTLDARVLRQFAVGDGGTLDLTARLGKVIARANVDYSWTGALDATVRQPINPRTSAFGRAFGELVGVKPELYGRERQWGGRLEAGVRLRGERGALELFAGYERVVDAHPFVRKPRHWGIAGFRLVNN